MNVIQNQCRVNLIGGDSRPCDHQHTLAMVPVDSNNDIRPGCPVFTARSKEVLSWQLVSQGLAPPAWNQGENEA